MRVRSMSAFDGFLRIRVEQMNDDPTTGTLEIPMRTNVKFLTHLLLALTVSAAAACGGDGGSTGPEPGPGPAPADVSGTYSLNQVRTLSDLGGGGSALPCDFIDGSGDHLVFLGGTLILAADGTFDMKVQVTFKGNPSELTDHGSYAVSDGVIDFDSHKATPRLSDGTVSGNVITAHSQFGGIPFEIDLVK
jgi:hypothetical protein